MNNEVACPINFTREEMKIHYLEGEGWNDQADFWDALRGFVERDGWTSNEDYKRALETFAELREPGLQDHPLEMINDRLSSNFRGCSRQRA